MVLKHDSQLESYRWPQGARPCGSCVRLRLSAPEGCSCTLRLRTNDGEQKLPMALRGYMNGSALYEYTLTLPEKPLVLWYGFIIQKDDEISWYGNNEESLALAEAIQNKAGEFLRKGNARTVKKADSSIYILHHIEVPAVLVECGFLSNPEEAALLCTEEYQNKLAAVIFAAVAEHIQGE